MKRLLLAVCAVLAAGGLARAADPPKPLDAAELDKRANKVAFDAAANGSKVYNAGDQGGCLKLYEGTLTALAAVLDHRPDLVKEIKDRMAEADRQGSVSDKAFTLRKALDAVMDQTGGKVANKTPLWERLGGQKAVEAVIHDFVALEAKNPKVDFTRGGKFPLDEKGVAHLEKMLVELVSATTGGPGKYTGKDMKSAHAGMKITDAEFDALAADLVSVLDKYKVPKAEKDELMAVIGTTRKDIVEVTKKPLWERLGGQKGVEAVVDEFLATASKDPKANIDRNGNYPLTPERTAAVRKHVVDLVGSLTGGPNKYTGRDMKNAHLGMKITEDEFTAAAGHLVKALEKFKVDPADAKELLDIVGTTAKDIIEVKKK